MHIQLPYAVVYTTTGNVPLSLVAKNLLAHEALIKETVKIINQVYPQVEISITSLHVDSITRGSLREMFVLGLFVAFQEDLGKEVPDLIEKLTGVDVPDNMDTIITVLVMIVATYITGAAINRIFPGSDIKRIKESYERKLEILSDQHGVDGALINAYMESEYKKDQPKTLVRRAVDFFKPAKLDRGANMETPTGEVLFSSEAVEQIPALLDTATVDGRSYPMENAYVEVHRADRDQNRHGWRAVIPEVSEKKVRLELHPELDPQDFYGVESLRGDVAVREEPNADGDMEPRVYYLNRISNEQN